MSVKGCRCGLVSRIASHPPERVIAGTAALEAPFYGCLKVNPNQEPAIVHWMRDTTAEYIREVQTLFNLVNAAASLYYAKRFLESANSRFYFAATLPPKSHAPSSTCSRNSFNWGTHLTQFPLPFMPKEP